jgi:hypothetical protein
VVLLQNFVGGGVAAYVDYPEGASARFVGEYQAGIAQVILQVVLRPPGQNIAAAYIGIVVAAFGVVVYGFEVFEARAVLAVFDGASGAERDQRGEGREFLGVFLEGNCELA